MSGGYYGEWVWNTDVSWMWNRRAPLEAGWSVRQLRDEGYTNQYQTNRPAPLVKDHFDGNATRTGGYVQQSWLAWSGRLRLNAGERWDRNSLDRIATTTPAASLSLRVASGTHFDLGWGEYVQYPEISVLTSPLGSRGLPPERSIHAVAGVEQRLGARTRLRAEFYDRADRDMVFQPTIDPRLLLPKLTVFAPPSNPLYAASLRGYCARRGVLPAAQQRQPVHRLDIVRVRPDGDARRRDGKPVPLGLRPAAHRQRVRRLPPAPHREPEPALELRQ